MGTSIANVFPNSYLGDSLGNFPFQLILALVAGLIGCFRFYFPLCLLAVVSGCYLNFLEIQNAIQANKITSSNPRCTSLRVGSFNLLSKSTSYESVRSEIQRQRLDVVLFQELTPKWNSELQKILIDYPDKIVAERLDDFGIGIYSRLPATEKAIVHLVPGDSGMAVITIEHCGKQISIGNLHTLPPASPRQWQIRNNQLMKAADIAKADKQWIMMGDFNLTPFSNIYRQFKQVSELNDGRAVLGLIPSWPTFVPPLWIPIDQLFYSSTLELREVIRGNFSGSDHWPIIAEFRQSG